MNCYKLLCEAIKSKDIVFIIHKHDPRNGSIHYDVRITDPKNPPNLLSFAAPSNFMETINQKTILAKTRDHDKRWLTLKSYRLNTIDEGKVIVKMATDKYMVLVFNGKLLKGEYKLFKLSKTRREDRWLLIKTK